ncbi:Caspase-1 precursor [Sarcoptes scabiei]|nr:Caspase-1 precursor [Sarcoptes scabiei]
MKLFRELLPLFIFFDLILSNESKRFKIVRARTESMLPSVPESQTSSTISSADVSNQTQSFPNSSIITQAAMYSEWSNWSRCRKRCKQVRTRICIAPDLCQSTVQKEERSCTGGRCRSNQSTESQNHNHHSQLMETISNQLILNDRSRGRNEFKVLYHLQSFVYSQWSKWSPCTDNCQTRRYRTCEMKEICGNSTIHEDAICAKKGSNCEKYFKSKSSNMELENLDDNLDSSGPFHNPINDSRTINDETCGLTMIKNDLSSMLRIIGGREATKGRWPWVVAILNRNHEAFCGGTLITSQFVITAAHCVRRRLYVRAGEHDLMIPEGSEQQEPISAMFVHPEYDPDTVDNDIALLKLRKPLKMNRYVSPICLPSADDQLQVNSLGTILGWGKRKNSAIFGSDVLHQAQVPIADVDDCKNVYKDKYMISPNMVCAGYKKGKIDSCAGDSGGPLLFNKKMFNSGHDKWYLYGITSFGEGCGKKNKYGIYAKVPNVVNWIRKTITENR